MTGGIKAKSRHNSDSKAHIADQSQILALDTHSAIELYFQPSRPTLDKSDHWSDITPETLKLEEFQCIYENDTQNHYHINIHSDINQITYLGPPQKSTHTINLIGQK